ncbi:hypothetical protein MARA_35030 [Mycolicibacterium arabiense]|jgi:hypothetical protein|uniref:Uncharacterized protein n=1 Tax=Mycolicibacterium arabiense TaxID=1286181 RepID=A0A7I7S245_9MYCO|nr:hypothetical protein [Mycolicibacterium arabiense]MBJ7386638.1 hypothetical protein [Mycolicibacterium sp.]MCV7371334.1 hypothetical protein [Mycolicibacterium arabiense]BBY50035.1 hypothetical protein MARA_35030 [Mycolicibacterium arabiense]
MLALLSAPVRRFLLTALLLPVIAFLLGKVGTYLQRRNGGQTTKASRALLSASGGIRRFTDRKARRRH